MGSIKDFPLRHCLGQRVHSKSKEVILSKVLTHVERKVWKAKVTDKRIPRSNWRLKGDNPYLLSWIRSWYHLAYHKRQSLELSYKPSEFIKSTSSSTRLDWGIKITSRNKVTAFDSNWGVKKRKLRKSWSIEKGKLGPEEKNSS